MQNVLVIIHVIISLILIVVVLMQHGKQQGLSGSIAGGAETFFGKNKGRTIDAMLRKFTSVFAALFIISSVTLAIVSVSEHKASVEATQEATNSATEGDAAQATQEVSVDEDGNLVDKDGNVVMTAEQMKEAEANANTDANANADAEAETNATE